MAQASRARVHAAQALRSVAVLEHAAPVAPPAPRLRLDPAGFDLIAELKLRSLRAGCTARSGRRRAGAVGAHARAGAAAVSVLTEPQRFDRLARAPAQRRPCTRPRRCAAMRKGFRVDPYQVLEARAAGAGGVLVILRIAARAATEALIACAGACRLFVLLEAFDAETSAAHELGALRAGRAALGRAQLP
jgi:indole-3-glycerol phosphate synthase